ncbi:MAG TPA: transglycosylase domain-containing protein, partial [Euzebya sp.]|nr:transglycosylase domain-containing protein [Euzebya sp.]
ARSGALVLLRTSGLLLSLLIGFVVIAWVATLLLAPAASGVVNSVGFGVQVPPEVQLAGLDQTSTVYAADGSVLAVLHDEVDRTVLSFEEIPEHVRNAVVAAEDRRFWEHDGYDVEGLGRALLENVQSRGVSQGGSTITQQLAKSEVGDAVSIQRKLTEIAFAMALERELTKEEILERYLNQVYFGGGAYGIAAAAQEYYGVDVGQLSPAQAATLAGNIRSPGATDPRNFPEIAQRRRDQTLVTMVEEGWLAEDQLQSELDSPLGIIARVVDRPADPYIAEAVKQEFYTLETFGPDRLSRNEVLLRGGLEIHTSFDPRLQAIAQQVVTEYLPEAAPTAALAAIDPRTGAIRAIYGGSDFETEQFNFATQGRRQPGSSFKPVVMATALEMGFSPSLSLPGASPTRFETGDEWEDDGVVNYGGGSYGPTPMRQALVRSLNTAFAQLILIVGVENVVDMGRQMGVNMSAATADILNPSLALGGFEIGVTPLEMAGAYSTFAYGGARVQSGLIDRVEDQQGNIVYQRDTAPTQILDFATNEIMVDTMQDVVCCGTAPRASISEIGWRAGGKTGTAQSNADAWFIGYTPVLSTAVWMGHPEGRVPMPGETGGNVPARIWHDFMIAALEGVEPVEFPAEPPGGTLAQDVGEGEVVLPDLREMDEYEALAALAELGLQPATTEVDSERARGTVVFQSPRAGNAVPLGSTVTVGISTGTPPPPPQAAAPTEEPTTEEPTEATPDPSEPAGPTENPPEPAPAPRPEPVPQPEPTPIPEPPAPQPRPSDPIPPPDPAEG